MKEYHVACTGSDKAAGTLENPFRTISKAAALALAGDRVIVHEGEYREWVKPAHGGNSSTSHITYEAAPGEKVIIKGSERIQSWSHIEGTVWKAMLPNSFFGDYNPYTEVLGGDWFAAPTDKKIHPGEVYLNGKAFYEAASLEEVKHPALRMEGVFLPWLGRGEPLLHPGDSIYQWYTCQEKDHTVIYANFHGADPNAALVEINVRKCCFYPEKTGLNYITVRNFEMSQAACPWTPPTADQPGLLGVNWSKGWIIENNIIHDAKCSGISLGKEASTGHNLSTLTHRKPGYQYQMEAVFRARQIGWSKETIGSHVVRGNTIYDCGQNGIVGHMGCVFSEIHHNHIYNIAMKREFCGFEIAGIKLHAAVDVQLHHNCIHHCRLGIWLDWQAQGARVSQSLFYANNRDLMVEATHGPYLADNNIFASAFNFDNVAQGGAYLHNLCCGIMRRVGALDRSTPYHFAHTTAIAGSAAVYSGDDRLYQNIFLGGAPQNVKNTCYGTEGYCGCPASLEEYTEKVAALGNGDLDLFMQVKQPAYINGNAYLNGAQGYDREISAFCSSADPQVKIIAEENGTVWLELTLPEELFHMETSLYATPDLEMPRITEVPYENPDGSPIVWNRDYLGQKRALKPVPGPLEGLKAGYNRICIWPLSQ